PLHPLAAHRHRGLGRPPERILVRRGVRRRRARARLAGGVPAARPRPAQRYDPAVALTLDTTTPFGARAARRLADDVIGWLVTVNRAGAPQPSPVWFLWDDDGLLIYSQPGTPKLRNIARNP